MTKIMTPSKTTTSSQINKAVQNYRALLEKHSGEFTADTVQTVLGQPELAGEQFAVFRRRVESIANLIVRNVTVNRSRTPQEALDATGRKQYTDRNVVDSMPKGNGNNQSDEMEVVFFKPEPSEYTRPGYMSDDDLEKAFGRRNLKSADPFSVAAVNEAEPAFADEKPHGTHWKNADGKWCFAAFGLFGGERYASVGRFGSVWSDGWRFAGVRIS